MPPQVRMRIAISVRLFNVILKQILYPRNLIVYKSISIQTGTCTGITNTHAPHNTTPIVCACSIYVKKRNVLARLPCCDHCRYSHMGRYYGKRERQGTFLPRAAAMALISKHYIVCVHKNVR